MNQQDKSGDEPEKTETDSTADGEAGQTPEDAAATAAEGDGEKPADKEPAEEEAASEDHSPDENPVADSADDQESPEPEEPTEGDPADDATSEADDVTAADADASDDAGSSEDARSADDEPQTIDLEQALSTSPLISDGIPPEPEPEPEPAPEPAGHEHEEEEHHRSFAARVLTWLILLIAGGGLALWGGPKVAPHLPSGLGPVKAWLMPGALETEAELDGLAARLDARIDAVEKAAAEPEVTQEQIAAAVGDLEGRLAPQIADLADQVSATDRAAIEGRLTQLETRVEGLAAQVQGLSDLGAGSAELSQADLDRISAFSASVEGLRAEVSTLADKQGALSQRIDDVAAASQRRLAEAEQEVAAANEAAKATRSAAMARAAATTIDAAITAGEPYEEALAQLQSNTDVEIPEGLAASAAGGVTPLGTLRESFPDAAHAAIRASIRAKDESSVGGRLASFIEAQVASRSLTPQPGDSTDAILSRAEDALRRDNLAAAVSELESLPEPARAAMADWIAKAEARVAARSALNSVNSALSAGN